MCVLSRPYDDQTQLRVRLETDAVLLAMDAIQRGLFILKISPVHFAEAGTIKDYRERKEIERFLRLFGTSILCDLNHARKRAELFYQNGIDVADAAHLAFAEAGADILISCDDQFVKRARKIEIDCKIMTPLEFCEKERVK